MKITKAKLIFVYLRAPSCLRDGRSLLFQHRIAPGFELVARFPLGELVGLRDAIADREKYHQILARAAQIPVLCHHIGRLMVVARGVVVAYLLAVVGRLADVVDSGVGIERRYTLPGKVEMI